MSSMLLHACCAPCAGAVIEHLLAEGKQFSVFYSNSNIFPREEYQLRLTELRRYCEQLGVSLIEDDYDHEDWLRAIRGLENEPERGTRCSACFRYRLERAAQYANAHGFQVLSTTLAASRWKDLSQVNSAGVLACEKLSEPIKPEKVSETEEKRNTDITFDENNSEIADCEFLAANWRKGGLQERRNAIIKEQGFYNQTWCGCEFSRRD